MDAFDQREPGWASENLVIEDAETQNPDGVAALYARYSTPKQKSIEAQLAVCRKRADERGWKAKYILTDEARKGGDAMRDGFQALLDLVFQRKISIIVCWKIDRVARSLRHLAELRDICQEFGVQLHSCTEPIDMSTPIGRFVFGNIANVAQLESDMIKERSSLGMYTAAMDGRWVRPFVPFGYRRVRAGKLRVHQPEAAIVRVALAAYVGQGSYSEAAFWLRSKGYTYRGGSFTAARVRQICNQNLYDGEMHQSGFVKKVRHLRIATPRLWGLVQQVRDERPRSSIPAREQARLDSIENVFSQYLESL